MTDFSTRDSANGDLNRKVKVYIKQGVGKTNGDF